MAMEQQGTWSSGGGHMTTLKKYVAKAMQEAEQHEWVRNNLHALDKLEESMLQASKMTLSLYPHT